MHSTRSDITGWYQNCRFRVPFAIIGSPYLFLAANLNSFVIFFLCNSSRCFKGWIFPPTLNVFIRNCTVILPKFEKVYCKFYVTKLWPFNEFTTGWKGKKTSAIRKTLISRDYRCQQGPSKFQLWSEGGLSFAKLENEVLMSGHSHRKSLYWNWRWGWETRGLGFCEASYVETVRIISKEFLTDRKIRRLSRTGKM